MKFTLKNKLLFIAASLSALTVAAQDDMAAKLEKYKGDNAVFLNNTCTYTIEMVKGQPEIIREVDQEILYISENTHLLNEGKVYYSYFFELMEIEALTMVPQPGGGYKTMKVTEFSDRSDSESSIFYDDSKCRVFVYPGLCKGARTKLHYKIRIKEPHLVPAFHFSFPVPVEHSSLKVIADKNVTISFLKQNIDTTLVIHVVKAKGRTVEHEWTMNNIKPYQRGSNTVPTIYYTPHIFPYLKGYQGKEKYVNLLGSNDDMFKWYYDHIRVNCIEDDKELKVLTDSITKGIKEDKDKAAAIYNWIQENVKYVAFEDGLRGYVPNKPSKVCSNRYGDCKDMANLLSEMLNMAGLKAYRTWIGTRDLPYQFSQLPLPSVSNHMISALQLGDSILYMDATGTHTMFGYPTDMIMGKEALIALDSTHYKIGKVPVLPASRSVVSDSVNIRIDGNVIKGEGVYALTGFLREDGVARLITKNKEQEEHSINGLLQKGNNKSIVDTYTINYLKDKSKPLSIAYTFNIRDYLNTSGNEMFINLHLGKFLQNDFIDTVDTKHPTQSPYKYRVHTVSVFQVPQGYKVSYVPANATFRTDDYSVSFTYKVVGTQVILTTDGSIDYLYLPTEKFRDWNKFIKKLNASYKECISIVKV
jgi:transglutaminase-like putative cysteine protease